METPVPFLNRYSDFLFSVFQKNGHGMSGFTFSQTASNFLFYPFRNRFNVRTPGLCLMPAIIGQPEKGRNKGGNHGLCAQECHRE
ncbi:hypothetical protein [Erwinia phyllosphaerae]|uniref:hypothetical protein n=1 Tax=Erwinia phyllosphaerae TaxID=2853256 RepID=UPI001FF049B9|nr:hypothetical protein [Erwinia phyllosphaerae]MBV4365824.1 hypothetical protein [Erwinia phyllosphaerae]